LEDLKRGSNKEIDPKDIFETASNEPLILRGALNEEYFSDIPCPNIGGLHGASFPGKKRCIRH
jgi:hypothetical protein